MDSPRLFARHSRSGLHGHGDQVFIKRKESDMNATTVAVDLAKSVFQLAVADEHWRIVETQRLTRTQFERWFANRSVSLVIMEACGSAHHWARWLNGLGIEVRLLPAQYVNDWHGVSSFHVGTGHPEPTSDAGYTTARTIQQPIPLISFLPLRGSPYRKG
jgi:hypothetical protein